MYKVRCSNPRIIVNPQLNHVIRFCSLVRVLGESHIITSAERNMVINGVNPLKVFKIQSPKYISDEFETQFNYANKFYLLNEYTGECYDFFQVVKCGQCSVCRETYVSSVKQRLMFALQELHIPPLFVTLTYDPNKQPFKGADVRVLQIFKKRLRFTLSQFCGFDPTLKFLITSEIGKGGNLHYHMIILGFPILHDNQFKNIELRYHILEYCWRQPQYRNEDRILSKSGNLKLWNPISFENYCKSFPLVFKRPKGYDPFSYGYINVRQLDSTSSAVSYVTKYIVKGCKEDASKNYPLEHLNYPNMNYSKIDPSKYFNGKRKKTICIISQNMGVDFVKKLQIRPDGSVAFTNWMDSKLHIVYLSNFYLKKLFPTFSDLVPPDVRRAYDFCLTEIAKVLSSHSVHTDIRRSLINTSIYLRNNYPYETDIDYFDPDEKTELLDDRQLCMSLRLIAEYATKLYNFIIDTDFDEINRKVVERDKMISRLKSKTRDDDVCISSFHNKQQLSFLQSKSIL